VPGRLRWHHIDGAGMLGRSRLRRRRNGGLGGRATGVNPLCCVLEVHTAFGNQDRRPGRGSAAHRL